MSTPRPAQPRRTEGSSRTGFVSVATVWLQLELIRSLWGLCRGRWTSDVRDSGDLGTWW